MRKIRDVNVQLPIDLWRQAPNEITCETATTKAKQKCLSRGSNLIKRRGNDFLLQYLLLCMAQQEAMLKQENEQIGLCSKTFAHQKRHVDPRRL